MNVTPRKRVRTTNIEFSRMENWLRAIPKPVKMTSGQLLAALSEVHGRPVSNRTFGDLLEATGVVLEDPRTGNFSRSHRAKRLADVFLTVLTDLDTHLGYKPHPNVLAELRALSDCKGSPSTKE